MLKTNLSKACRKIPLELLSPFDEDNLMIILSPELSIVLKKITNYNGDAFSISSYMELKKEVFATPDFKARCKEFSENISVKLERMFDTQKARYLFFDEEEQKSLLDVFKNNQLTCEVELYINFIPQDYETISVAKLMKFNKIFHKLEITEEISPFQSTRLKNKVKYVKTPTTKQAKEDAMVRRIHELFPQFIGISTKKQFNQIFKALQKQYHPDVCTTLPPARATRLCADINAIKDEMENTFWFRALKEGD